MTFLVNPFWYPPNTPVVQGSALSVQVAATATFAINPIQSAILSAGSAAALTFAGGSNAGGAFLFEAELAAEFSALEAPSIFTAASTSTMTMVGAATATAVMDVDSASAMSALGAAVAASVLDVDATSTLTGVGSTTVTLLLLNNFNGSDGATTFTDEVVGITWTRRGAPFGSIGELDTATYMFGSASLLLPVVGTAGAVSGSGFSSPHAGNWTIEGFVRVGASNGTARIYGNDGSDNLQIQLGLFQSTQEWALDVADSSSSLFITASGSVTIATDTWYHFAIVRDVGSGTYAAFFNGSRLTLNSTATDARSFDRVELHGTGSSTNHWFDSVRVTGNVMYTGATYTPPASEF